MTDNAPPRPRPSPEPDSTAGPISPEEEPESAVPDEGEAEPDPYDDLWDPDMDTRPERIKRTKARPRTDSRLRGRAPTRSKRREDS